MSLIYFLIKNFRFYINQDYLDQDTDLHELPDNFMVFIT
jgi:hypothetical protein